MKFNQIVHQGGRETHLQRVLNKFSMDVIGSCVFGVDPASLDAEQKSRLVHHGEEYGKGPCTNDVS